MRGEQLVTRAPEAVEIEIGQIYGGDTFAIVGEGQPIFGCGHVPTVARIGLVGGVPVVRLRSWRASDVRGPAPRRRIGDPGHRRDRRPRRRRLRTLRSAAAGLTVIGGRPAIVFVSCSDRFADVGVYVDTPLDARRTGPRPTKYTGYFDWTVRSSRPDRLTEITMFAPPPAGWSIGENAITTLQPGVTYSVSGFGQANALPVRFTTADLDGLNADRVLVGAGPGRTKIVSRPDFGGEAC